MKILTFSIAAYNVELYLQKTLDSFVDEHLLNDIEVIIVDDGSKDMTSNIALVYVEKYPQTFRLISKPNGGHGSTINTGLKEAKGKYFKVVDGDDWVDTKQTIELVKYLKTSDVDLILTHFKKVYTENNNAEVLVNHSNGIKYNTIYSFEDSPSCIVRMHQITVKTDVLRNSNVIISENCFYVDSEYDVYCIAYSATLIYLDLCIYMYRIGREGQSITIKSLQKHFDMHKLVSLGLAKFYNKYANLEKPFGNRLEMMMDRIAAIVIYDYKIHLSFKNSKELRIKFMNFDENLKGISIEVWNEIATKCWQIKNLRENNYRNFSKYSFLFIIILKIKKILSLVSGYKVKALLHRLR